MRKYYIANPSPTPRNLTRLIARKNGFFWASVGEKEILRLFHAVARRVPAYKDFLLKHHINTDKICSLQDFANVPPIDKQNYLKVYSYKDLVWDGDVKQPITIHSTSGSTGEPTYLQRNFASDLRREFIINNFFKNNNLTITGPTLLVITFGMGVWSGGMGLYTAAYLSINFNKYPISIVSPGVNKIEVLKILKRIAPDFKQVVIAGYPPFVKDVLDEAVETGVDLGSFDLRFIFTGEAFSEEFRDYVAKKSHLGDLFLDTMNTYGTSEFGATAVETPLSILVRRLADKQMLKRLFGDMNKTPTLAQYIPYFVNFECVEDELILTGDGAVPLIRYKSGDNGGVLSYEDLEDRLSDGGIDLTEEIRSRGLKSKVSKLPFVYVYERKNLATTLYGVLIYPEFIKAALMHPQINSLLTGKFTMVQKYTTDQDQYLEINLELKKDVGITKTRENFIVRRIVEVLKDRSSEFRELAKNLDGRVAPRLVFWPQEYPEFFASGTKQKWVKKN